MGSFCGLTLCHDILDIIRVLLKVKGLSFSITIQLASKNINENRC